MSDPPKGLRDLDLPLLIETSDVDFAEDFYNPALSVAEEYKRGVGYFTSSWFQFAARGLKGLAENGGTAKWIISPILEEGDWEALQKGEEAKRDQELYDRLNHMVSDIEEGLEKETQNTIAWMIADGLLDIRIAITGENLSGDFHDKWGIVRDPNDDKIAFHGSQNDSRKGFSNYESYSVFASWMSDREAQRIDQHEKRFDEIWDNAKQGVHSISLPDSISLDIAELRSDDRPYDNPSESKKMTSAYRWRHQEVAVNKFLESGHGILDMATGTGKTRTSLKILNRLLRQGGVENVVVATRGNDLLDQWYGTLSENFSADEMWIYQEYGGNHDLGQFLTKNRDKLEALIISYDNLHEAIDGDINNKLQQSLLIADEVHNMGSDTRQANLTGELDVFKHRLGLSATPFDPYDPDRNDFLRDEVGPVVYEFSAEDAIRRGILCETDYTPLFYELSEEDKEEQKAAFGKFKGLKQKNPNIPKSQLYIMLAKVRKTSEEKLPVFREYLEKNPDVLEDALVFVETKEYGHKVQKIIHDHTKSYRTYYGEDPEETLEAFSNGEIGTLVSSKAISEGIDIKSVKNIILFTSNRSKGTTIQRIGRALRTNPENPGKTANIVDFVVRSDIEEEPEDDEVDIPPDKIRYDWLTNLSKVTKTEDN
ncbi:DEAD/DEAH box helicase family protein [Salarchaeum japonicum]|uniref:DEAD/DEAH box helicase family protein n=1 Tax=Salarchaeum japonicum TaxID=555573 RepID=A0AAV3SZ21_9EURY|nr:DEAD/DEAH box helicase family protein [Salarchaeum japonicum]